MGGLAACGKADRATCGPVLEPHMCGSTGRYMYRPDIRRMRRMEHKIKRV